MVPEEGSIQVVLLRHKAVRDDLKLTTEKPGRSTSSPRSNGRRPSRSKSMPDAKERDRKYEEMARQNERFLDAVLTSAQHKRLIRSLSRWPAFSGSSGPTSPPSSS